MDKVGMFRDSILDFSINLSVIRRIDFGSLGHFIMFNVTPDVYIVRLVYVGV